MTPYLAQALQLPGPNDTPVTIQGIQNFKFKDVGSIITGVIPFVFAFAGIGLLLMILGAGFTLLTSAGDAKKMEAGKQRLTYAVVGFVIIFSAYWLVQAAGTIFGLTEIQSVFK